jgi:hypothetical protein
MDATAEAHPRGPRGDRFERGSASAGSATVRCVDSRRRLGFSGDSLLHAMDRTDSSIEAHESRCAVSGSGMEALVGIVRVGKERRFVSTSEPLRVTWGRSPPPPGPGSPCSRVADSLSSFLGKSPGKTREEAGIGGPRHARKPGFAQFPCTFPVDQGIRPRDGFALACTHRHVVCRPGKSPVEARLHGEDSRNSAGFRSGRALESGPETLRDRRSGARSQRGSLLTGGVVRFRPRFASAGPECVISV